MPSDEGVEILPVWHSVSSDRGDHAIDLVWYSDTEPGKRERVVRIPITELLDVMQTLNQRAFYALDDAVRAYEYGDCATCGNIRLVVQETRAGYSERVHCPDCRKGRDTAVPFATVPSIPRVPRSTQ